MLSVWVKMTCGAHWVVPCPVGRLQSGRFCPSSSAPPIMLPQHIPGSPAPLKLSQLKGNSNPHNSLSPRARPSAGSLFQTFPLSRFLKASMQLSGQELCNLAVKGSTLKQWSLIVSRQPHGLGQHANAGSSNGSWMANPMSGPLRRPFKSCRFHRLVAGHGAVLDTGLPQHRFRHRVRP